MVGLNFNITRIEENLEGIEALRIDIIKQDLLAIEGYKTAEYYRQIFSMLPKPIRIDKREHFKAYDGVNNLLNLA